MLETLSTYSYLQNPSSLHNCFPSKTKLSQVHARDKSTFDWSEPHLLWIFWEWCVVNSSSSFVKVSKKCQKGITTDFEIFPGGNGSVRLAATLSSPSFFDVSQFKGGGATFLVSIRT